MRGLALASCGRPPLALATLLLAAFLAVGPATSGHAESSSPSAYSSETVRALFLFNFIRFTDWPAEALPEHAPFVIGVAGDRTLEDELVVLADKQTVRDRRVRVVRVKTARDLSGCHVLYVSSAAGPGEESGPGAEELLPQVRGKPVLTVSDSAAFLPQGGIVSLYLGDSGKLRFEIALENAKAGGLVLSSRLLALARIVDKPTPEKTP